MADRVARPRVRKEKGLRKQELVTAAITVLAEHGYEGFSLANVARTAGVSPALIIVHFGSKEGLLEDVLAEMGQEYFSCLHASQAGAGPRAVDRLWRLVTSEFDESYFTPRYLSAWRTFWVEINGRKPYLRLFGDETRYFTELTTTLCAEIMGEGGLPGHDPATVARIIDTALGGMWIDLTQGPVPLSVDEARHMTKSLLVLLFPRQFTLEGPLAAPLEKDPG